MVALIVVVSICSGFYPALVLSGFKPILVLKNQAYANTGKTRRAWLRKSLTVSQFVIAEVFIMATLIVGKQIQFSLNKDLGFKKDAIISFRTPWNFYKYDTKRFVLLDKLHAIPGIEMVSLGSEPPASGGANTTTMKYKDGKKEIQTDVQVKSGDTNYLKLYQLKLLAGRNVMESDTQKEMVINETYARIMGFTDPHAAIGALVGDERKLPVIGVMADFHQKSLHTPIKPLALMGNNKGSYVIHIALAHSDEGTAGWKKTIASIESAYKGVFPEDDFDYKFFDQSIAEFYSSEQNISRLLQWATGLAILISCLGMLGLVMYTTNLRTKEIGVRKVLGASVANIVTILSKDFVRLVIIAFIIASPVAWWAMTKWLQNFAYRTSLSWWLFAASGLLIIIVALLTLSFQTIRAARANPVKSLRTE
jgi:ABC-type antimicrobial peptide transport system permease subunit